MADEFDYSNSQDFADGIVDSTLDALRDQEDLKQSQILNGKKVFSPAIFQGVDSSLARKFQDVEFNVGDRRTVILGPIKFEKRFATAPDMAFSQLPAPMIGINDTNIAVGGLIDYVPFLVDPFSYGFTFTNGEVDGFYLGLYAKTRPSPGISQHTISWIAVGTASRYTDQGAKESWSGSYDYNEPSYLVDETEDF